MDLWSWGRLLRLSNAPTILGDLAAGYALGVAFGGGEAFDPLGAAAAALACLALYLGALVLNDLVDLEHDRATRPDRPLPAGKVRLSSARLAFGALVGATLFGAAFAPATVRVPILVLAVLAWGYDLLLKRSAFAGPLALGGCRALDLTIGVGLAGWPASPWPAALPIASYGAYVFALSALARTEDATPSPALARGALLLGALFFLAGPASIAPWVLAPGLAALLLSFRALDWTRGPWTRARVGRSVGMLLRLLLVHDGLLALAAGEPWIGAAILALFPLARLLARRFPPT